MKLNRMLAVLLAGLLAASLLGPAATAKKKKGKKKGGPLVVGTDPEGDWGNSSAANGTPVQEAGAPSGSDLVKATIAPDGDNVNFIISVTELPELGGTPEVVRYIWSATVDGEYIELDGKFTNYSRGACDPTAGTCPPPRDPGQQPFLVRGNCSTDATANLTTCEELGIVQAIFDVAEATVTIPVPLELINAHPGSKIAPGSSDFTAQAGGTVLAIASAFVSRSDFPADGMYLTKTFKVPGKKG